MGRLVYYIFILPLSLLPHSLLYGFADFLYFVIYKVLGYRKDVVRRNLSNSFPEKSKEELLKIEKRFYHHLTDLGVESLKNFSISEEEAVKRMQISNPELLNGYFEKGQNIILAGGHYNNWELFALAVPKQIRHTPMALFTPLKNKFWNEKMTSSRSKYGLRMSPLHAVLNSLNETKEDEHYAIIFGSDQCPRSSQLVHFMNFLNQETAVTFGAERLARDFDIPILAGTIHKIRRGYYEVTFNLVSSKHSDFRRGEITEGFTRVLEEAIKNEPEYWLWSHKRWKRSRADHNPERII